MLVSHVYSTLAFDRCARHEGEPYPEAQVALDGLQRREVQGGQGAVVLWCGAGDGQEGGRDNQHGRELTVACLRVWLMYVLLYYRAIVRLD